MSRFFSEKLSKLTAYVPGEQPQGREYVKLNTNESPFPPPKPVLDAVAEAAGKANLYSDPEATLLKEKIAQLYHIQPENVLPVNGSDEVLYFAFLAFGDETHPFACPEISYGFYPVFGAITQVPVKQIPLAKDFSIDYRDYLGLNQNIVIANPNAPTGLTLSPKEIEEILSSNRDHVVVIDEAYVDFGGESVVPLIAKYENLLVTQTFSKSRSLAGARLGFGFGQKELIQDLNTVKYSINPYNVNRMTQAAGIAAIACEEIYQDHCQAVQSAREFTAQRLRELGFTVLPSKANFLFAKKEGLKGEDFYQGLKERGVLIRHFAKAEIADWCRISIGSQRQMERFLAETEGLLREKGC